MNTTRHRWMVGSLMASLLGVWELAGCGPIQLGQASPLAGTWDGINPGGGFVGTMVFDYSGNLESIDLTTKDHSLSVTFDGQLHHDSAGQQYSATATTTITDGEFRVRGYVEYSGDNHGIAWITIEGQVQYGSMAGTVTVAFPGEKPFVQDFTATRS